MKIAIITGSIRPGRNTHKITAYLEKQLVSKGASVDDIDLAFFPLPLYGAGSSGEKEKADIKAMSARLEEADGFILVTPEYHGSFSGILKNALDHFWSEFKKKPIGVVAVSNGRMAGINASSQLQHVILSIGAFALPLKLLVGQAHIAFNDEAEPAQPALVESTDKFLTEYLWLAEAIYARKQLEKNRDFETILPA